MSDRETTRDEVNRLHMRVAALEAQVQRLTRLHPSSHYLESHPAIRNVPTIPIPPDNSRSIEEILAVVSEIREWVRPQRIT